MKQGLQKTRSALDGVEAFLLIAEHRSFTTAAQHLGVSPSAISQTIRALETRVGVPLLTRTTRSVGLTQAGEQFLEHARPAISGIGQAIEAARSLGEKPAGRLRINLMRAAIVPLFEPILGEFCAAFPDIELEIFADEGLSDIMVGGFDAGVRLGESLAADMVAIRLTAPFRYAVVGTPDYFEKNGVPQRPTELLQHKCVRMRLAAGGFWDWIFVDGNRPIQIPVKGPIIVNDSAAYLMAAHSGAAIGMFALPAVQADLERGNLVEVLSEYAASSSGAFLYYPDRRQILPKLRVFIDFMQANRARLQTHYWNKARLG